MNNTRYYSSRQEHQIAKLVNGRVVSNSGATMFQKGDVSTKLCLIEAKTCVVDKTSFSIKKDWLVKNKNEAFAMNKPYSALAFNFGPDQNNYFIIDENLMQLLLEKLEESQE